MARHKLTKKLFLVGDKMSEPKIRSLNNYDDPIFLIAHCTAIIILRLLDTRCFDGTEFARIIVLTTAVLLGLSIELATIIILVPPSVSLHFNVRTSFDCHSFANSIVLCLAGGKSRWLRRRVV